MSDFDWLRQRLESAFGQFLSQAPELARLWGQWFDAVEGEPVPLAALEKPLREVRLALVTTGGVHLRAQTPFDMRDSHGDPSYRVIPADTPVSELMITHDYYDHSDAERDLNILFPLELARELAARGAIGSLGTCYSFMGHIEPPHVETLILQTAPEVAAMLRQEQVDAVLLTPA